MLWLQMLALLSEDEQDFVTKLYEKFKDEMYRTAMSILKNRHDAEDAVNNIMLAVISNLSKYEGQSDESIRNQLIIYMRSIIRNISINTYNKRKRIRNHETDMYIYNADTDDYDEIQFEDESHITEDIIVSVTELEQVKKTLLQLPQDVQDTLNLVCVNGYTSREAAAVLQITPEAVRARVFYARKKIKKMLEEK